MVIYSNVQINNKKFNFYIFSNFPIGVEIKLDHDQIHFISWTQNSKNIIFMAKKFFRKFKKYHFYGYLLLMKSQ